MSDRSPRYGMIVLDGVPAIVRVGGQPLVFTSPEQTLEYAQLHGVQRWMIFGDPEGWWPIYTQAGPVSPPPPPKERVDISLTREVPRRSGSRQPPSAPREPRQADELSQNIP